ncbi:MAG: hypothetical protein HY788_17245, partial [Deltaproteobacteria bacterium]|nr:hypothetical protein [Deltaproteobacteria bacterium]
HVLTGLRLLEQERFDDAQREFNLAIELDPKFSMAYSGLGIVHAMKGDFKTAYAQMEKAEDYMKENQEKLDYHVGMIRILSAERGEDWVDKVESQFKKATKVDENYAPAYYFTGLAYRKAYEFGKAADMFTKVIELNGPYVTEANDEWKLVQKIQRAAPGTIIGKKIALIDKMTRADVAALFIQELKLAELYKSRGRKDFDTSYKSPEKKFVTETIVKMDEATDIQDHPLKTDIDEVMKIGVRGLEAYPDHTWHPNELINRAEYAIMIEDILIKLTGDDSLATEFVGSKSPFPDLRSDLPYFNAVMVVTSRGVMEAESLATGEFNPLGSIDGADALLVIRKLKNVLKI